MAKENINQKGAQLDASLEQTYVEKNLKKLAIGGAVVLTLVVCGILLNWYMGQRNEKAAQALYPCEQYFQAGNYEKALNGDGAQCEGFLAIADQYGCTKSGNVAKLYAGVSLAKLGKHAEAKEQLEAFSTKDDQMISPAALGALGNTYVQLGENEKGAETLVKAAKKADNNVLSPLFLVQAGEVYESLGQTDKALALYEQVKANYRASLQGSEIDKYIERAKGGK